MPRWEKYLEATDLAKTEAPKIFSYLGQKNVQTFYNFACSCSYVPPGPRIAANYGF